MTACTTAAPRPDDPPVTSTLPNSAGATTDDLLDESGAGPSLQVWNDGHLTAPLPQDRRLRKVSHAVVASFHEDVRTQSSQHRLGRELLEHRDGIDAAERF